MDDLQRLYPESPRGPKAQGEDRDRVRCESPECAEEFVVEHVGDTTAWTCPRCRTTHPNLHLHFVVLGLVALVCALASFGVLVVYLWRSPADASPVPWVIWSALQISLASYLVLAIFSDPRAYGLRALRLLVPVAYLSFGVFVVWLGARLWIWSVVIAAPVLLAAYGHLAWVYVHAFRMAEVHRPRETVVRPMYSLISIAVHAIVLTIFTSLFIVEQKRTPGTSSVEFGKPGGYVAPMQVEKLEEMEEEDIELDEQEIDPDLEKLDTPIQRDIEYKTENEVTFHKIDREDKPRIRPKKRTTRNVKYQQRYNRQYALEQGGGSDQTEYAVLKALRWLKAHQNEDGSWGEDPLQPSMTGLALLCFLGHGDDHLSAEFGACVRKAIEWLRGNQDAEGFLAHGWRFSYQHGIATYALGEAYAMTEVEVIRPVVKKAVEVILYGQTDEGGWYYGYSKGGVQVREYDSGREFYMGDWPGGDTSISGWQIQALTAAWFAGIRFPNGALGNARRKALADIKSRVNTAEGWSGYHNTTPQMRGDSTSEKKSKAYALTAIATLCLQFLGDGDGTAVRSMLGTMKNYSFDWARTEGGWQKSPLYAWYYVTQAKFQAAAPKPAANRTWQRWNKMMTTTLLREQHEDGSWGFPAKSIEGKQHVQGTKNKPVYSTTLCCLMLEVYYRYLPTYRPR